MRIVQECRVNGFFCLARIRAGRLRRQRRLGEIRLRRELQASQAHGSGCLDIKIRSASLAHVLPGSSFA